MSSNPQQEPVVPNHGEIQQPYQISRAKTSFIRTGIIITIALSAWSGIWMSSVGKVWAVILSVLGGFLAMVVGMVLIGIKHQDDLVYLTNQYAKEIQELKVKLDGIEKQRAQDRREFGIAALGMTKLVADRVAIRLLARHASNLHLSGQRDAAIEEANAIIAEEILSYGQKPKSK